MTVKALRKSVMNVEDDILLKEFLLFLMLRITY